MLSTLDNNCRADKTWEIRPYDHEETAALLHILKGMPLNHLSRARRLGSQSTVRRGTGVERSRDSWDRDLRIRTKGSGEITSHRSSRVTSRRSGDRHSRGVRGSIFALLQTLAGAVGVVADIDLVVSRLSPHREVFNNDIGARGAGRTVHLDRAALGAVLFGALPVADGDVVQLDAFAVDGRHAAPGLVDVQGVGISMA